MEEFKTGKVATWVGDTHENTIRDWSRRYAAYLSKNANAARRRYSRDDVRVLATIANYRVQGLSFDAIEAALKDGKRLADEEMPPEPSEGDEEARSSMSIIHIPEDTYLREQERLSFEIQQLERERNQLKTELKESQTTKETLQNRVIELEKQISAARAELEIIKQERRPASYWLTVIVGVILAFVVLLAGAVYFFSVFP